jgi:hypothetical protein
MLLTTIIPSLVEHGGQPFIALPSLEERPHCLAKPGRATTCLAKPGATHIASLSLDERPIASLSLEERPHCLAKPGRATTCLAKPGATPHCLAKPGRATNCLAKPGRATTCLAKPGATPHCLAEPGRATTPCMSGPCLSKCSAKCSPKCSQVLKCPRPKSPRALVPVPVPTHARTQVFFEWIYEHFFWPAPSFFHR